MVDNFSDLPTLTHLREFPRSYHGTRTKLLTQEQENESINMGNLIRRQDIRYLEEHPEIRAITTMLLTEIWKKRPKSNLAQFCADFFSRPRHVIERDLESYLPKQASKQNITTNVVEQRKVEEDSKLLLSDYGSECSEEAEEEQEFSHITTLPPDTEFLVEESWQEEEYEDVGVISSTTSSTIENYKFTNSVEVLLEELKYSLYRIRQLGLEDIKEEPDALVRPANYKKIKGILRNTTKDA